jgi:hypothetical protein
VSTQTHEPPFVGRRALLDRLAASYRAGRHVLLVGPPGVGKSRLLGELSQDHPFLVVPRSRCLGDLLGVLEPLAGLESDGLRLAARVHRLTARLPALGRPLALESVQRVPPKVAHFVRFMLTRQPVWLVASSTQPLAIGHAWPFLFHFERLTVPPFSLQETRAFLAAAYYPGNRSALLASSTRLHRLAAGHPGTLAALVDELRVRRYDLGKASGLRLLSVHARITSVTAQLTAP